jgi:Glycine zipper 2TM domain
MNIFLKLSAIAAASASLATAIPATAAPAFTGSSETTFAAPGTETYNQYRDWRRDRRGYRDDYRRGYGNSRYYRGNDRRYRCNRGSGTTGLILGGGAGALLGRSIDGGRDRTLGTVLGAAGGALLGREIDRGGSRRC